MQEVSNLELRQFRQFVAVAEELHFRRAAARLGMAQPPLSQAMQKLERDIGVELLDRTHRQVRLTEAGVAFLEEARRTLAQAEKAVAAARRAAGGRIGSLRMTYVGAAAYAFLPRLVRAYRERFPDVELELREGTTSAQIRALRMGEADVGLVRPPIAGADDLRSEVVLREPLVAVLPDRHPLAGQARLRLQDLRDEGFVLFPAQEGPSFHARIVSACEQAGFSMRVVQEAVQMHAIIGLVSAGVGVALVPASMRNLRQVGVVYRDLTESPAELRADLALVWRRGEPSSVVTAFLDLARKLPNDGGDDQAATGEGPQCTERWAGERGPVCR